MYLRCIAKNASLKVLRDYETEIANLENSDDQRLGMSNNSDDQTK
jgi:hypothetical protein